MVLSQMWWINYLQLQLYLDILHRYEPTDDADNNLQCRHGPFPGTFLAWNFKIVNTTKIQDTYKTRSCRFVYHLLIAFFNYLFLFYFFVFYFFFFFYFIFIIIIILWWERVNFAPVICIPGPTRAGDIVDTARL